MRSSLVDTLWTVGLLLTAGGLIVVWAQCRYLLPATHFLIFLVPSCVGAGVGALYRRKQYGLLWGLATGAALLILDSMTVVQSARE